MIGDKSKFVSLNENKTGNVTFGNDEAGRIRGKGTIYLNNGRGKSSRCIVCRWSKRLLLLDVK